MRLYTTIIIIQILRTGVDMLRILHCVVGMNYGGYETFLMNVYRNIDRTKVQFDFLTSMPGVFDEEIKKMGGTIYRIPFITKVS